MRVGISSLALALLILGSAIPVSLPFSSAGNSQSILFGTIILEIIDVNVSQNTTHAGVVIDVVTTINASWDVIDFSGFHVETYYDSQLIDSHVVYVVGTGQEIINVTSVWNTTGVEPGLYTISAIAYGSNIDNYVDGFVQILPPPRTWIVDDDGPADFSTIQEAINAAWDGDTIFVRNGTYNEHLIINKTLMLAGENRTGVVIDGNETGRVVSVFADNCTITGFTVRGGGFTPWGSDSGIYMASSNNFVTNDNLINNKDWAVWLENSSSNNTVSNNLIANNWRGIYLNHSAANTIAGNNITDANQGICFESSSFNVVWNNDMSEGATGIAVYDSSLNNSVTCNTFSDNSMGVDVGGQSAVDCPSNNTFYHNNFIGNYEDIRFLTFFGTNSWENGYPSGGNYWSDYNGTDLYLGPVQDQLGSDGVGDTPYLIDATNIDHYPLMNPWTPPDAAALDISSSRTIIGQGFSPNVTVLLENQGNKIEELNATFYANDTFIGYQTFMLRSNNSITYSSNWNLSSLAKGNYSLSIYIAPLEGETDLNDNSLSGNWIFITIAGDLNGDKIVDIYDAIILANHFGFNRYHPAWNPNVDLNDDGLIDLFDAILLAANYGESWT